MAPHPPHDAVGRTLASPSRLERYVAQLSRAQRLRLSGALHLLHLPDPGAAV